MRLVVGCAGRMLLVDIVVVGFWWAFVVGFWWISVVVGACLAAAKLLLVRLERAVAEQFAQPTCPT